MTSRRAFVATGAQALAGLTVSNGLATVQRALHRVSASDIRGGASAASLFPSEMAPPDLQGLATRAVDAARSAGASFADIRIAKQFKLLRLDVNMVPALESNFSYGIRVVAGGSWAFIYGCLPDPDRLVASARDAVASARGFAALGAAQAELAPAPVVRGEWATPIQGDPFLIPIQDQGDLARSYDAIQDRAVARDLAEGLVHAQFNWTKEVRVFASTDGSLTTQTLYQSQPWLGALSAATYLPDAEQDTQHLSMARSGGYETVTNPQLPDRLKAAAEAAAEAARMPARRFDVGRFPVVMDGFALGNVLGQTLGVALEADRALGYESGAAGLSFLAPPTAVLGQTMINPRLTVTADRALPHLQAVKWDDDGVEPETYTVIKAGVVVDYHTSRQTAPALAAWYRGQGRAIRSHGCAAADTAGDRVLVQMPHLTAAPASGSVSLEDLYRGMSRGLVVTQRPIVSMDQQLSSGALFPWVNAFEVVRGKIVGRVKNVGLQFRTLPLWKSLTALGDISTVCDTEYEVAKGARWQVALHTTSAPAGMFVGVNVVDVGGTGA